MVARCYSGALNGAESNVVEIEVNAVKSSMSFAIVGLPDAAVKEAKDRVSTALSNSAFGRNKDEFAITVNLAPANVRKEGPIYDLPIAIALLKATKRLAISNLEDYALVGELSLSGEVRRVRGVLPIVIEMKKIGKKAVLVPQENAEEASVVQGIDVIPVKTLREAADFLSGNIDIEPRVTDLASRLADAMARGEDFADVRGQQMIKRAIEVAVAGGHNILMIGSPGSGKTMLARRIPSILPPLSTEEAIEVSKIHSVAGREKGAGKFVVTRPFRAPHHTVSSIGLLGGGAHAIPGEVSLAHRGVLFLDEFAEFPRGALEVLRQPLEDGKVSVSRAVAAYEYPSRFMLVAAMNPCPCGYYGDETHECRCTQSQILKYQRKISGPLLDRIDIQVYVNAVPVRDLEKLERGEESASIRERIVRARAIQALRYGGEGAANTNAEAKSRDLRDICRMTERAASEVRRVIERVGLSARAYDRILRVSRTIADLEGKESVDLECVMEASAYRMLDQTSSHSVWA